MSSGIAIYEGLLEESEKAVVDDIKGGGWQL
jgi:hypothetical protein